MSLGGHFQFKHEKSWDINTGPSLYDKYFEINMEDLNIALCTIPFYERNIIEQTAFSEADILTMNNRSTKFKQKYYNDKSYSTPETEVQDKILNSLRGSMKDENISTNKTPEIKNDDYNKMTPVSDEKPIITKDINLESENESVHNVDSNKITEENILNEQNIVNQKTEPTIEAKESVEENVGHDDFIFGTTAKPPKPVIEPEASSVKGSEVNVAPHMEFKKPPPAETKVSPIETKVVPVEAKVAPVAAKVAPIEAKFDPIQRKSPPVETQAPTAAPKGEFNIH